MFTRELNAREEIFEIGRLILMFLLAFFSHLVSFLWTNFEKRETVFDRFVKEVEWTKYDPTFQIEFLAR